MGRPFQPGARVFVINDGVGPLSDWRRSSGQGCSLHSSPLTRPRPRMSASASGAELKMQSHRLRQGTPPPRPRGLAVASSSPSNAVSAQRRRRVAAPVQRTNRRSSTGADAGVARAAPTLSARSGRSAPPFPQPFGLGREHVGHSMQFAQSSRPATSHPRFGRAGATAGERGSRHGREPRRSGRPAQIDAGLELTSPQNRPPGGGPCNARWIAVMRKDRFSLRHRSAFTKAELQLRRSQ